jgi:hypothetical protein
VAIASVKALGIKYLESQGQQVDLPTDGSDVTVPLGALTPALKHPLHIVAFCDEEGVRFKTTFLGSRAIVSGGAG